MFYKKISFLFCFIVSFFSYSNPTPQIQPDQADWTVALYLNFYSREKKFNRKCSSSFQDIINWKNKLAKSLKNNKKNPNLNIVFHTVQNGSSCSSRVQNPPSARGIIKIRNKNVSFDYERMPRPNMGDRATLKNFMDYVYEKAPAKKHALYIHGHGLGWSYISSDRIHRTKINAIQLSEILKERKQEVIHFKCCSMADIETAYQLRSVTNYMNASQLSLYAPMKEDFRFLDQLCKNPTMNGLELTNRLRKCDISINKRNNCSTISTAPLPEMSKTLNSLAHKVIFEQDQLNNARYFNQMKRKVEKLENDNDSYDLKSCIDYLLGLDGASYEVKKLCCDARDLLKKVVIHNELGKKSKKKGCGISIDLTTRYNKRLYSELDFAKDAGSWLAWKRMVA